jgi:hypothetical protein
MTSALDAAEEMDSPGELRPQAAPRRRAADWAQEEALGARSAEAASAPAPASVERSRFPFSIVWSPLPGITWFLPFVGHMGITDSRGVIYDCESGQNEGKTFVSRPGFSPLPVTSRPPPAT